MTYRFHPGALDEYLDGIRWYAAKDTGLGEAFVDDVEEGVHRIVSHPQAWQPLEGGIRRCLLKRFPFAIYYAIEGEAVLVYALMHTSRRPDCWRNRIR